jgi:hypothetical protein
MVGVMSNIISNEVKIRRLEAQINQMVNTKLRGNLGLSMIRQAIERRTEAIDYLDKTRDKVSWRTLQKKFKIKTYIGDYSKRF